MSGRLFLFSLIALGAAAFSPFDMPALYPRHQEFLAKYMQATQAKDPVEMELAARAAVMVFPEDANWKYNVACALALQDNREEAFRFLDEAITLGFHNPQHILDDPDLISLRTHVKFMLMVQRAEKLQNVSVGPIILPALIYPGGPALVSTNNTVWDYDTGTLVSFFSQSREALPGAGLFYLNRDGGHSLFAVTNLPGLTPIVYSVEARKKGCADDFPISRFRVNDLMPPVLGNCSKAMTHPLFWRSLPRGIYGEGAFISRHVQLFLENQMFFYPSHYDWRADKEGDVFQANTPYVVTSAGASGSDQPFLKACFGALAAVPSDVMQWMVRTGLVMPTVQRLLRESQRGVIRREDYLTGAAHPAVFDSRNLDTNRMIAAAHALTVGTVPPVLPLRTVRDEMAVLGEDYFDIRSNEGLFDSPFAIARVVRGTGRSRTLVVDVSRVPPGVKLHWCVLQGDSAKVCFKPLTSDGSMMEITVAYHGVYTNSAGLKTSRVDLAVIGETANGVYTCPSFVTFVYPRNEIREYAADGRILSVDYETECYYDPFLSIAKRWKDIYRYTPSGKPVGWERVREKSKEEFTVHGQKILTKDAKGRALTTAEVHYIPRAGGEGKLPDLSQFETGKVYQYTYESDNDFSGRAN